MPLGFSRVVHRVTRRLASAGLLAGAAGWGLSACASSHHRTNEAPPHPIAVEVQNNLTVPTELTIYIAQDQGGFSRMIGTVPGNETKTFTFTPISWGDRYRLIGRRQLGPPLRSPPFTIASDRTGTIAWSLVPGIVTFYDVADTTTVTQPKDTTKH